MRQFSYWGLLLHVLLPLAISRSRRKRLFPKAVPHDSTVALMHDYVRWANFTTKPHLWYPVFRRLFFSYLNPNSLGSFMKPSGRFIWKRTKLWSQGTSKSPDYKQTLRILHPMCVGILFNSRLLWQFIHAKLLQLYNLKMRLGGEICPFDVNVNKGCSTKHYQKP